MAPPDKHRVVEGNTTYFRTKKPRMNRNVAEWLFNRSWKIIDILNSNTLRFFYSHPTSNIEPLFI